MSSRGFSFIEGEYYHIYNRGVEKRIIFQDKNDLYRFLTCLKVLNTTEPIGSLFKIQNLRGKASQVKGNKNDESNNNDDTPLVEIVCFALLPNHYHLLLKQSVENGISQFMQRLGTAHTMYFNEKYERSGSLFQGKFKASHVDTNEYLLHLSAYINRNNEVHRKWLNEDTDISITSYKEYLGESNYKNCNTDIIISQFASIDKYKKFCDSSLNYIKSTREKSASETDLHFFE